jgi:hypothetical protein
MIIDERDPVPLDERVHGPLYDLNVHPDMLWQLEYIDAAALLTQCVTYLPLQLIICQVLLAIRGVDQLNEVTVLDHSNDIYDIALVEFVCGVCRSLLDFLKLALEL